MQQSFWDERYRKDGYAYGEQPNLFLKSILAKMKPGNILFPAEGQGRNAVYAAKLGWNAVAFDQSAEGKKKALQLARKNGVTIHYEVGDLKDMEFSKYRFDAMALIYAYFNALDKSAYHKILSGYLRKGGTVIFEAFSKRHLQYNRMNEKAGGPKDAAVLFSVEEIRRDFEKFEILQLEDVDITLNEGQFHIGKSAVIRFVGIKQ